MPRPTTSAEFLALLDESRLIDEVILKHLRPQILDPSSKSARRPEYAARALYENNVLTGYQARQLMAGRYRGFYIAKYKFLELLGVGGMGKVYLAEQIDVQRLVVIKVVRHRFQSVWQKDETFARFRREAEAVAKLSHPNIIKAFEYDQENGVPYIAMEYVEGVDLGQQVDRFGVIEWAHAADNILQAASALQHAHDSGMVHRDVKPQNLLVSTTGQVKLLDLGLVSPFEGTNDDSLTTADNQIGSVDYIAPEQALDSRLVDPRADIYGLGASFYSIISGQVLYPEKSTSQKLLLNQTTMPTPIGTLVPDVPEELAAVITKMLAKSRDDRFSTMAEVQSALQPFASANTPPYDISAVKFPTAKLNDFLGRSPNASTLSKVTIGQGQPTSDRKKREEASSTITTSSPEPEYEDLFSGKESDIAHLGLPPISHPKVTGSSSRNRSRSKEKQSAHSDLQRAAAVMAGVGVFVMIPLIGIYLVISQKADETIAWKPRETIRAATDVSVPQPDEPDVNPEETQETLANSSPPPEAEPASVPESDPKSETTTSEQNSSELNPPEPSVQPEPETLVVAKADVEETDPPSAPPVPAGPTWDSVQSFQKTLREDGDMVWFASFIDKPKANETGNITSEYFLNESTNQTYAELGLYLGNETLWRDSQGRWKDQKGAICFRGKPFLDAAAIPEQSLQDIQLDRGFTIGLWVRIANTSLSQVLVSRGPFHWRLTQNNRGHITWSINRPGSRQHVRVQSPRTLVDENWHYLVAVYQPLDPNSSQARIRLYIDGVEEGSAEGDDIKSSTESAIVLGLSHDRNDREPLRGVIDDFMLLNRPVTDDEAQMFYNQSRLPEMEAVPPSDKSEAIAAP